MLDAKGLREIIQSYNESYNEVADDIVERLLKNFISALDIIKSSNRWSTVVPAYKIGFVIKNESNNGDFESLTFDSENGILICYSEEDFEEYYFEEIDVDEFFCVDEIMEKEYFGLHDEEILFCKPIIESFNRRGFSCYVHEDNINSLLVVLDLAR